MPAAGNASSKPRKDSPGTVNAQRTPAAASASAMSRATVVTFSCRSSARNGRQQHAHDDDNYEDEQDASDARIVAVHESA
jgi:hypothetical protein